MGRRTLMRSIPGLSGSELRAEGLTYVNSADPLNASDQDSGSELRAEGLTQVNSADPLNASDQDSPIFDIYFLEPSL